MTFPRVAPVLLLIAVAACYSLALSGDFVYDDHFQLVRNPYIKDFSTLKVLFTKDVWSFSSSMSSVYFRPFHMLVYLLIYQIVGLNSFAFHLANLLFHVLCVLLVYLLLKRYLNEIPAFFAALIFGLHPAQVEPVAWIAGTPDVMYSAFVLCAFWFYLERKIVISLLLFAGALFSKEPGILLPAVILIDHRLFERKDSNQLKRWIVGATFILVGYFLLRIHAIGPPWKLIREVPLSFWEQMFTGISFAGLYLLKFLYPSELNVYYDYRLPVSFERLIPGWIAFAALITLAVLLRKNRKMLFGICWFLIFLTPALLVKAVSASLFSERYLYLSIVGLLLAFFSFGLKKNVYPLLIVLCVVLGWVSFERTRIWQNDLILWSDTIAKSPDVPVVNFNLATAYFHQKDWEHAGYYFEQTVRLQPEMAEAYSNLAVCRYNLGDRIGAAKNLREFLARWKGKDTLRQQAERQLHELESQ